MYHKAFLLLWWLGYFKELGLYWFWLHCIYFIWLCEINIFFVKTCFCIVYEVYCMLIATYSIMLCNNNRCFNTIELVFTTRTCITVHLKGFIKRRSFFTVFFHGGWLTVFFHGGCRDTREQYCRCIVYNPAIPGQPKRLPVSKTINYLLVNLCYN